MPTIVVRERGVTRVSEAEFRALEKSRQLWTLVDRRIVSLVRSGEIPFGVRANSSVGEALIDDSTRLIVREKSPGALRALLRWAAPDDFVETASPSLVGPTSPILDAFAGRFLAHLGDYLGHGRVRKYLKLREETASPRGRVDLRASINLRARGIQGRLVCRRSDLTPDLVCNHLLANGLRAVDDYLVVRDGTEELLSLARTYAPLFEDVDWQSVARLDWFGQRQLFDATIEEYAAFSDLVLALKYARALTLHLGSWPVDTDMTDIPASYFLNLETLFEDAVRETFKELVTASKGADLGVGLFSEMCDRYIVNPDLVLGVPPDVTLVADCKYKELDELPEHADVYQLLAHCTPLHSPIGLLVYPGSENRIREIGRTSTGVRVFWATVVVEQLRQGVRAALAECGALDAAA